MNDLDYSAIYTLGSGALMYAFNSVVFLIPMAIFFYLFARECDNKE